MESLPNLPILEFPPDTIDVVRKEFNLHQPGRITEAIDILDDWAKKQNHFVKKDFPRGFFERTLTSSKGLIERAKIRLDRYCTFKTLWPIFYTISDIEHYCQELKLYMAHAHLPKFTPEYHRIYMLKFRPNYGDGESDRFFNFYKYVILHGEYLKKYEYYVGQIIVIDFRDISIKKFVSKLNINELHQGFTILTQGYGMRTKSIHFISPSKMVDSLISIGKMVLSDKLLSRLHVHKTIDSLYDFIPKEILPEEYGGNERSLETLQDEWIKIFTSNEFQVYLEEMHQAKTDEDLRLTGKIDEQFLGIPGTFRSLNLD